MMLDPRHSMVRSQAGEGSKSSASAYERAPTGSAPARR
jgi:hypothetical protein